MNLVERRKKSSIDRERIESKLRVKGLHRPFGALLGRRRTVKFFVSSVFSGGIGAEKVAKEEKM